MLTTDKFDKDFLFEWENNNSNSWNKYFQLLGNDIYRGKIISDKFCNDIISNFNDSLRLKLDLVIRSEASDKKHTGGQSRHCFCCDLSKVFPTPSNQSASIGWEPFIFQFAININFMLICV